MRAENDAPIKAEDKKSVMKEVVMWTVQTGLSNVYFGVESVAFRTVRLLTKSRQC